MRIDKWFGSRKVEAFPWIDGKRIYFNVRYYRPGQSIERPPAYDKTVFVIDNPAGRSLIQNFTDSLVAMVEKMQIPADAEVTITL